MRILAIVLFLLPGFAFAAECRPIDTRNSKLQFEIQQAETPFTGRFSQVSGEVCLEGDSISRIHAEIAAASVETGLPELDSVLKDELFFDVERYPQIRFSSDSIEKKNGQWIADGTLVIRKIPERVQLPFELDETSTSPQATGEIEIRRLDFGVGTGEWENTDWLSDIVRVHFIVQLQ